MPDPENTKLPSDHPADADAGMGAAASFLLASLAMGAPACEAANTDVVPNSNVEMVMMDLRFFMMDFQVSVELKVKD